MLFSPLAKRLPDPKIHCFFIIAFLRALNIENFYHHRTLNHAFPFAVICQIDFFIDFSADPPGRGQELSSAPPPPHPLFLAPTDPPNPPNPLRKGGLGGQKTAPPYGIGILG